MITDENENTAGSDAPPLASAKNPPQAVMVANHDLEVIDGEHHTVAEMPALQGPNALVNIPPGLRMASDIAYTGIGAIIVVLVAVALVVTLAWFAFDLTSIHPSGLSSNTVRNLVINAVANLLANVALILVLVEVLNSLVSFIRTRRASARPLLLIPLFVIMRAIILLVNQVVTGTISSNTEVFIKTLAEMGAFALVGLFLCVGLAFVRDPTTNTTKDATKKNNAS
jgi:uncharacterized membrane protein (DUF373 family)